MDNQILITAGITSAFTALAGIAYKIYLIINHKRIRSTCCNKEIVTSIDIENTTPPNEKKESFKPNITNL